MNMFAGLGTGDLGAPENPNGSVLLFYAKLHFITVF